MVALAGLGGCFDQDGPSVPADQADLPPIERDAPLERRGPQVPDWASSPGVPVREPVRIETHPHDTELFTQGLDAAVLPGGDLVVWEGTGLVGRSVTLLRSGPDDGFRSRRTEPLGDGTEFGEGLAFVPGPDVDDPLGDGFLVRLTWKDGVAYRLDPGTLAETQRLDYEGEGWGACWLPDPPDDVPDPGDRDDGTPWAGVLATTDGSSAIVFRHPLTLEPLGAVRATTPEGEAIRGLNELDCADGHVWANVWGAEWIAAFDPADGTLVELADLSGLRALLPSDGEVLNGITRLDGDRWLATGKRWPLFFELTLE